MFTAQMTISGWKEECHRPSPGDPVVKISPSTARAADSIPGQGAFIPHDFKSAPNFFKKS